MADDELEALNISNLPFLEEVYEHYVQDPLSVGPDWRHYFRSLSARVQSPAPVRKTLWKAPALFGGDGRAPREPTGRDSAHALLQEHVDRLVHAYREIGHRAANLDPLGPPSLLPHELDPAYHDFGPEDMKCRFVCPGFSPTALSLDDIVRRLRKTYCRSIGVEYMHIADGLIREWLRERMESTLNHTELDASEQTRILARLTTADVFEKFTRRKFIGAKTFSLEGAESLVPLLGTAVETAARHGLDEIVLAMAHRGRLNILANILGKSSAAMFREFQDADFQERSGRGDVAHHLGHSADWKTEDGRKIHLSLCFNPSHLEFVNPVALGRVRAKQDREGDAARERCFAILIHGEAGLAGQGVTQETLNLAGLEGYATGGALHVVLNNRIGFTTPPSEYTSSEYVTGVMRMLDIPVFHVNGDDPEAVVHAVRLAMEFRRAFARDAVIDMYCYRRLGHNETDEPAFTQPLLYDAIEAQIPVREKYLKTLVDRGSVNRATAGRMEQEQKDRLKQALSRATQAGYQPPRSLPAGVWEGYRGGPEPDDEVETAVDRETLTDLLLRQTRLPTVFTPHPKIEQGLAARREMAEGKRPLDWAAAESLAFAALAVEGIRVRLSGQDTARGTFGHRHAVLHDRQNGRTYVPLQNLSADQAPVEILNSPLSEAGALGFDYGYSLDCPQCLILWEAQFGDFANAAQVIIDQFITSAEDKWNRLSGITLLLPHGFEGMGPEHSSGRLERFLMLAAEDNMQVVCPSTPAQYFHVLRRQGLGTWKKPLVVFTPKSLLRSARSQSSLEECAGSRRFERVLTDRREQDPAKVRRILLCSGKLAIELEGAREERGVDDVAVLRLEQLYPLRDETLSRALDRYTDQTPVVWVQEEPVNMGAWRYLSSRYPGTLPGGFPFSSVSRPESASPATGSPGAHRVEQKELISRALGRDGAEPETEVERS